VEVLVEKRVDGGWWGGVRVWFWCVGGGVEEATWWVRGGVT